MADAPMPPGSTIGILGSGQLGRMLAVAAAQLGFRTHIYCDKSGPAFDVTGTRTVAAYDDLDAIAVFARSVDVVTYEFENIPRDMAEAAMAHAPLYPPLKALETSQDRIAEKGFLTDLGIAVAPYVAINNAADVARYSGVEFDAISYPALLKTSRSGYDGKGQIRIAAPAGLGAAWDEIGNVPAVLEEMISFSSEVSVIGVRHATGEFAAYDIAENHHQDQILKTSTVPAGIPAATEKAARAIAGKIMSALDYTGVLAVEFFHCPDDPAIPLIVNEFAPRVHNSGHWTLDACLVSQFENHIRAITGWPLGTTERHCDAVMTNLIGNEIGQWRAAAGDSTTAVHHYGKGASRPGRKMGHLTRLAAKSGDG